MKKIILFGFMLLSSSAFTDGQPGKPPDFWCRVSPSSNPSESFLAYGTTSADACALAMVKCRTKYGDTCSVESYGEW